MLEGGQQIAEYQIITPLGENQVFASYLVRHPQEGEAKLLLLAEDSLPSSKSRRDFLARGQLFLERAWPGICPLLDLGTEKTRGYCVYRKPSGHPLIEAIASTAAPRRALELLRSLAEGLIHPHETGLCHGNISPAMISLDQEHSELTDFGFATLVKLDFHSGMDARYAAPELVRGEPAEPATDIYALGILITRLLTGAEPFAEESPFALATRHVAGEIPPLPEGLTLCQPLLDGMLAVQASERLTAPQLVDSLDMLLADPAIDQMAAPEVAVADADAPEKLLEEQVVEQERAGDNQLNKVLSDNELSARIEARLKERADLLSQSADDSDRPARANSSRVISAGKQQHKTANTAQAALRNKRPIGRLLLLALLGVLVGTLLYRLFFGPLTAPPQPADPEGLPMALSNGLEQSERLLEQEKLQEASRLLGKLIADFPGYPQPYNNLAAIHAARGDFDQARRTLERAMATDDSYATVYRNLGTIYAEMARDSYGKALQLGDQQTSVSLQMFAPGGNRLLSLNSPRVETRQTAGSTPAEVTATAEPPNESGAQDVPSQAATAVDQPKTAPAEGIQPAEQAATAPVIADQPVIVATEEPVATSGEVASEPVIKADNTETEEPTAAVADEVPEPEPVEAFLKRWAESWAAQDVAGYLSFYLQDYTPSSGRSHQQWIERRKSRITRPDWIKVELSDFSIEQLTADQVEVEVNQAYSSDRYADRTRKRFALVQTDDSWRIVREQSLGRVR